MYLLVAQSTFDEPHEDDGTAVRGEPIVVDEKRANELIGNFLARPMTGRYAGALTERGRVLYHYGGGYYHVADPDSGRLIQSGVQGEDNAREAARKHAETAAESDDSVE